MSIRNLFTSQVKSYQTLKVNSIDLPIDVYDVDWNTSMTLTVTSPIGQINLNNVGTILNTGEIQLEVTFAGFDPTGCTVMVTNYGSGVQGRKLSAGITNPYTTDTFTIYLKNNSGTDATGTNYQVFYVVF